jgi:hypothetical protein
MSPASLARWPNCPKTPARNERGVALGVLSTAIGALPIGMAVIGVGAQLFGTRAALIAASTIGLAALGVIVLRARTSLALDGTPPS